MNPIVGLLVILLNTGTTVTLTDALAAGQTAVTWLDENTWDRLHMTPAVYPVSLTTSCADPAALRNEASVLMESMGIQWIRLVIVTTGCPFTGLGSAATGIVILNNTMGVLAHELGHTFWISHNALVWDPADPMSAGYVHFSAPHKGKIDWTLSTGGFSNYPTGCYWDSGCDWVPPWNADLIGDGTVRLAPTEVPPTDVPIAARLPVTYDSAGRVIEYAYLEYRTPVGFDAKFDPQVQVRLAPPYNGFQSLYGSGLSGSTQYVTSLRLGQTWTDCARQVSVTVTSLAATAMASISRALCPPPPPPDLEAPLVTLTSPADGSMVARRSTVILTAAATDNLGIAHVIFLVNGGTVCDDAATPYECAWRVPAAPNRTYQIQALALDAAGNIGSSALITVKSR